MTLIAFLRGINLGPVNRVPMGELRRMLEGLGYEDVQTHLQSGNVVLESSDDPRQVEEAIAGAVEDRLGLAVPVVVRTASELARVVADNPLRAVATDPSRQMVAFLSEKPKAAALRALGDQDFAAERLVARGREIHAWCPHGVRRSEVMKALDDKRLGVTVTVRNWNTVTRVHEIAQARERG